MPKPHGHLKDHVPGVLKLFHGSVPQVPVVVDSPHSGQQSPDDFGHAISPERLAMTVDAFVDELFEAAPGCGATFLQALFPRTYIDPNRAVEDVDPGMLDAPWPGPIRSSAKVRQGIGLVANRDLYGRIYQRELTVAEVRSRIDQYYWPYHRTLKAALDDCWQRFGAVWHLNCHSMRSYHSGRLARTSAGPPMDICIGDRDGETAALSFRELVVEELRAMGYRVTVNAPYKGVELVQRYAAPAQNRHSLQIEISRALYMDENRVHKHGGFPGLKRNLDRLLLRVCEFAVAERRRLGLEELDPARPQAAE